MPVIAMEPINANESFIKVHTIPESKELEDSAIPNISPDPSLLPGIETHMYRMRYDIKKTEHEVSTNNISVKSSLLCLGFLCKTYESSLTTELFILSSAC